MMFGAGRRKRCDLCERHRKMETADGALFWIEWDGDDQPILCAENRFVSGVVNAFRVRHCPMCGKECKPIYEQEENYEQKKRSSRILWAECRTTDTKTVSER